MSTRWFQPQELDQPYPNRVCFTHTSNSDLAVDVVTLTSEMELGTEIDIVVYTNDCYVNFDEDAARPTGTPSRTQNGMQVRANTGYSKKGVAITRRISVITAVNGSNFTITGTIWGR